MHNAHTFKMNEYSVMHRLSDNGVQTLSFKLKAHYSLVFMGK